MEIQEYKGKVYKLYKGENYFSRGCKRLHRVVWETETGQKIPNGFHVHHIDGNSKNNSFNNLELVKAKKHSSYHGYIRLTGKEPWFKEFHAKGINAAKIWHASVEGRKQHSLQAIQQGFGKLTYGESVCEVCNKTYTKNKKAQNFCSNSCKSKYRRDKGVDNETRKCQKCENTFEINKYAKRRFCSKACQIV